MSYIWKIPNKNDAGHYCLNLTEQEEQLFILCYMIAKNNGKEGCFWMSHIEQHFFNNANALSMYDLCQLNTWMEDNGYENLCYIPYPTENPSNGLQDRAIFSERRDKFLAILDCLEPDVIIQMAHEHVTKINLHSDEIEMTNDQQKGIDMYEVCMNEIAERGGVILSEKENEEEILEMPELVEQDDFIIGEIVELTGDTVPEEKVYTLDSVIDFIASLKGKYKNTSKYLEVLQSLKDKQ